MIQKLRARRRSDEQGFTLIELMVVVLIIAILIAIAIPAFLGARKKAQDRAAQSNLRNALTAEKSIYSDGQAYTETPADLEAEEPSLTYTDAAGALGTNEVYVTLGTDDQVVYLSAFSKSGKCYFIKDSASDAAQFTFVDDAASDDCNTMPADADFKANADEGW